MKIILLITLSCLLCSLVAQPENDHCESAIVLPAQEWCSKIRAYTIFDATPSISEGQTCTGDENALMKDVWFEFTALGNFVFFGVTALEVPVAYQPRLFTISIYTGGCTQKVADRCVVGNVDVHWIIGDDFIEGQTYLARVAISVDSLRPEDAVLDSMGNFGICLDSYNDSIVCSDLPVLAFGDTLVDLGNGAQLSATAASDSMSVKYDWFVGDSLVCDHCPTVEVFPEAATVYTVVADDGQCQGQDQVEVQVRIDEDVEVYVPNAFSPNGDLNNDRITIYGGPHLASILQLDIYDRWGELVFRRIDFPPNDALWGWDGSRGGNHAPNGVYTYLAQVKFSDGSTRQYSGTIQLLR